MKKPPNWQRIALELRRHKPLERIAEDDLGWHKGRLNLIARGQQRDIKFAEGVQLLDYAHDAIGAERLREVAA